MLGAVSADGIHPLEEETRMARTTRRPVRPTALLAVALVGVFALAGCSTTDSQALPPVIADITTIDGTTVTAQVGDAIDLIGDDTTFTAWTADIADESIVRFVPGKDDGSAQFNPGLDALKAGRTEVTLDNSSTGDEVTFTVEVTEK